jgi:hypothetical protein
LAGAIGKNVVEFQSNRFSGNHVGWGGRQRDARLRSASIPESTAGFAMSML